MNGRRSLALLVALSAAACDAPPSEVKLANEPVTASENLSDDTLVEAMNGFSWVVEGRLAGMPKPGRSRPLARDIAYLSSQRIELLISLTEEPTDPVALAAAGIDRLHLPVADFTAPTLEQLGTFVAAARGAMDDDRAVGVHCTAGLGRTGTFMAAYFVSEGMSADDAIAEIRRLRPGSVETREQEARIAEFAASLSD